MTPRSCRVVCLVSTLAAELAAGVPARLGAQAPPGRPMPIDLAFGRRILARENPIAVAPDGSLVAYVVHTPAEKSPRESRYLATGVPVSALGSSVFISPVSGGSAYAAAPDAGNCWRPVFAPDGRRLAFYCDQGGMPQLWMHDLATRGTQRVSEANVKAKLWAGDGPKWSPDGREVYVPLAPLSPEPPPAAAVAVAPAPGPAVTVYRSDPAATPPGSSSDDKDMTNFYLRENNAAVGAIDVASGKIRVVAAADATPRPSVLRVSPSGRWVAYLSVFHKPRALDTVSFHDLAVVPSSGGAVRLIAPEDRKSTRLNSSHQIISYAVFCLKKKNANREGARHGLARPRNDTANNRLGCGALLYGPAARLAVVLGDPSHWWPASCLP